MNKINLYYLHRRLVEISLDIKRCDYAGIRTNIRYYFCKSNKVKGEYTITYINTRINYKEWLDTQFSLWLEHCADEAKNKSYPVEKKEYMNDVNKKPWKNPRRVQFLDFLIEQACNQLNEMN